MLEVNRDAIIVELCIQIITHSSEWCLCFNTYSRVTALANDLSENVISWIAFRNWHHVDDLVGGQRLTTTVDLHHLGRLGGLCRWWRWCGRLHSRRWRHDDDLLLRLVVERGGGGRFSCCYLWKIRSRYNTLLHMQN